MCAIAGIAGPAPDLRRLEAMTRAQRHRGPDGEGLWHAAGIALGHRRLKIIDLSEAGRQPMSTADGRFTIVFNGEVYNYAELREALAGEPFRSRTDTEAVLYAYARWGAACLERFVGMFALAIWDAREAELFCARDRLGIKPFYYAERDGHVMFGSEIRALLAGGVQPEVNPAVLYDFLARDFYEHTEETFFAGIRKLAPGHWMRVRGGRAEPARRYWDLKSAAEACAVAATSEAREERLLELASEAVRSHLVSDVPVGIALSGGLDSATLLSLVDRVHPDPTRVEAFSFAFAEEAYSERPFVLEMARHTGRRAHFSELSALEFADTARGYAVSQEEPFAGAPISAYARCYELARQRGFIVLMDGSGVDEGLAGYGRFRPALWADLFAEGDWASLEKELSSAGVATAAQRTLALEQLRAAVQPQADEGVGQDLTRSVRPECLNGDFVRAAGGAAPAFERPFGDHLRNVMYRELRYTKLPRALRFRDRLSMAVGTELRPPFLDHRLLAYEFALPATDRIHRGVSKAILRRAAARLLPDAVRLASKRSVQTPQREWFRGELRDWVRERVDTATFWARGWVDRRQAVAAMDGFFEGAGDNSFFLWQWINLELWAQEFLDRRGAWE
jgi:asparagine synthase (glutamine-hydrolysing)